MLGIEVEVEAPWGGTPVRCTTTTTTTMAGVTVEQARLPAGGTPVCGVPLVPRLVVRAWGPGQGGQAGPGSLGQMVGQEDVVVVGKEQALPAGAEWGVRCRWFRSAVGRQGAFCSVHAEREASLQCMLCLKKGVPPHLTYHCSPACFRADWARHKERHRQAPAEKTNGTGRGGAAGAAVKVKQEDGEAWIEVGSGRSYTPKAGDVGYALLFHCILVTRAAPDGADKPVSVTTKRIVPAPNPPSRRMVPLALDGVKGSVATGKFTLLTYNMLADLYATPEVHENCPTWALDWSYRRQCLLRELVAYRPDILCLQEVQSDHFEDFFSVELQKHGYAAVYKRKTTEVFTAGGAVIDGCATFYRRDRFTLVKKYEVEFNKAALSLADALGAGAQKKQALNRLLKDNVALIVVLEALEPPDPAAAAAGKRQLLCVANTHIHANPELKDVKLWQVHTLLKGLEKIAASADIPMLVTGDFNSVPGSAAHHLLVQGRIPPSHPELATDPIGILRPANKLCHHLPLVSAYAALATQGPAPGAPDAEQQRQRVDAKTHEPVFTNSTSDFTGTLDYIFYTSNSLITSSCLELPSLADLRKSAAGGGGAGGGAAGGGGSAIPNPEWPSDHVALMCELRFFL